MKPQAQSWPPASPPPSTPPRQPPQVLQGKRNCPRPCPPNRPPSAPGTPTPPKHHLQPPCGCQARGGAGSPLSQAGSWLSPEPLWQPCSAQREGRTSQRLPGCRASSEEASPSEHRLLSPARSRRQTDRHGEEGDAPPPYSTFARAEASLLRARVAGRSSRPCLPAAAAAAVERLMYEHLF